MEIHISHVMKKILDDLVRSSPGKEFTLFGKTRLEGEEVHLVDIRVPSQTSSGGDTELSEDDNEKFLNELLDGGENPAEWNMWIHSHHSMGAFWSGTDTSQMESFNTGGPAYFFHVVLSTEGYKGAFTLYKPFFVANHDVPIKFGEMEFKEDPVMERLEMELLDLQEEIRELEDRIREIASAEEPMAMRLKEELKAKNKSFIRHYQPWEQWGAKKEESGHFESEKGKDQYLFNNPNDHDYIPWDKLYNEYVALGRELKKQGFLSKKKQRRYDELRVEIEPNG